MGSRCGYASWVSYWTKKMRINSLSRTWSQGPRCTHATVAIVAALIIAITAGRSTQAAGMGATGIPHAPSSTVVPANVRVSHGRYQAYGEPYLAVNPRNPRNLLGAAQCINGSSLPVPCTFDSLDGGVTWHDNGALPLPAGDKGGGDVSVAFTARGTGFVAAHAGRDGSARAIFSTRPLPVRCCWRRCPPHGVAPCWARMCRR